MRKKYLIPVICLLLSATALSACNHAENNRTNSAEEFLQECFSLNKDGRYDAMLQSVAEDQPAATENNSLQSYPLETVDTYYQQMADLATETCLDTLRANRIPASYDKIVREAGLTARIETLQLTQTKDNTYTFEISFDSKEVNSLLDAPITGQVTVCETDGAFLADTLRIF